MRRRADRREHRLQAIHGDERCSTPTACPPSPATSSTPDQPEWDLARRAWNLAVDQRPALVALPADAGDVLAVVDYAIRDGLKVAPQGTGHNAAAIASLEDTILVSTQRMRGVEIDVAAQTARVQAGTLWLEVTEAATPHGLFPLSGSSPDVGVVGYTLGGGLSWLARKHGLAANNVTAIEVVTPDGRFVRATAGGARRAVLGAARRRRELRRRDRDGVPAVPVRRGLRRHVAVAATSATPRCCAPGTTWTRTAPEEVTTSFRIIHFPPLPELPPFLSGRSVVVIDGAYAGEVGRRRRGARRAARARAGDGHLGGVLAGRAEPHPHGPRGADAVRRRHRAARASSTTRRSPRSPRRSSRARPCCSASCATSAARSAASRRAPAPPGGCDGEYLMFGAALVMDPESAAAGRGRARALHDALAPYATGKAYLNFVEQPADSASFYADESYARLRAIRAAVDPDGRMVGNHPIPAS